MTFIPNPSQALQSQSYPSKTLRISSFVLSLLVLFFVGMIPAQAQTFTSIYSFGQVDASQNDPDGGLVQARDGNLYGEMNDNLVQIYRMTPAGGESVIFAAPADTGDVCFTGMTLGLDGLLYGTCSVWNRNTSVAGIIFKLDPTSNAFTIVYSWPPFGAGGEESPSALTLGNDGNFYGTTQSDYTNPLGTVFKVTPSGTYTTLHAFQGSIENDGAQPSETSNGSGYAIPLPLLLGRDGNFYGTTDAGGLNGEENGGTVYKITPQGKIKILYYFVNGEYPSGVTQGSDGNFYGQTADGGTNGYGSIFKLTPGGTLTTLYNFNPPVDFAAYPKYALTLGTDGNFYDASADYQSGGYGPANSLFELTPKGIFTDLFNDFGNENTCTTPVNGCYPSSPLLLHTNGLFYGTTGQGGLAERGVLFSLETGLAQFASLQTTVGNVGATVNILGQGFTTATKVSFGGTSASFTAVSDTFLTAKVPVGALTGVVSVVESGATLKGKQQFKVTPTLKDFTPDSGPVGTSVTIDGSGFTQATKVTIGAKSATYEVTSDSKITATVPTGAKIGKIVVTTKGGSVTSASKFTVN